MVGVCWALASQVRTLEGGLEPGGGAFAKLSVLCVEKTVPAASVNFPNRERPWVENVLEWTRRTPIYGSPPGSIPELFNWLCWVKKHF